MCNNVHLHRAVTLHNHSVGLVAEDVSENQEVELLLLLVFGDL